MSRSQLARWRGGVTSEDDLAYRIERIGPPVFAAPAAPIGTVLAKMVERTNETLIPGMPPVSPGATETRGRALWDALVASDGTDAVAESLLKLFGLAA